MQLALPPGIALRQNCSLPVMLLLESGLGVWAIAETTEAATSAKLTIIAFIGIPFSWKKPSSWENAESDELFQMDLKI